MLNATQVTVVDNTPDLSIIIKQIQILNSEAFTSSSDFVSEFQNSVNTLRSYAGLGSVILHKQIQSKPDQTALIIYTYRFPHIKSNTHHIPPLISTITKIHPFISKRYTSHTISPEIPPPNNIQHSLAVIHQVRTTINA